MEFHSEEWRAAYIKRIDATIAALKAGGVPVFWVGLPPQRNPRISSDWAFLNELFRARAERAGIIYVDVWDGFVDEAGRYSVQGPDFEGQIRRLRSGDGVYFTKAGARKLAHYLEREIQRSIVNRAVPMALPAPEPAVQSPRGAGPRPLAGPVVPLTAPFGVSNELLGGARVTRPAGSDPTATRVLTRGEPLVAPSGRADNFAWPRAGVAPAAQAPSESAGPSTAVATPPAAAAAPAAAPAETAKPRPKTGAQPPAPKRAAQQRPRVNGAEGPPRPPLPILPR
jgi:hypothetical protein